jgi:hypothetical protein
MRRFTGLEKVLLIVAVILILIGMVSVLHPVEKALLHPGFKYFISYTAYPEFLSKTETQVYRGLVVAVGAVMLWLVFFRGGKD